MTKPTPRMYGEFAPWFHLITAPASYAEEASIYFPWMADALGRPPKTLLELGSGGGNNASHFKAWVACTLTDLSPEMLALSRTINPECPHFEGDMRTIRLGKQFDLVFVHDAVAYLTTEDDLRQMFETVRVHCKPDGVALIVPDYVRETFEPETSHGGHDGDGRSLRYLEWVVDPDPNDTEYVAEYVYVLREDGKPTRVEHDQHIEGLFPRELWLRLFGGAGFDVTVMSAVLPSEPDITVEGFVGVRQPT